MKRLIIVCVLYVLCGPIEAANEIRVFAAGTSTAYSIIRETDGDVFYITGQVFEAFGTGDRAMADYDIALVDKSADMFVGDFDTDISAGTYYILSFHQAGGAPADTDPAIWTELGTWDGDEWFSGTLADVNDLIADVNTAVWTSLVADFTSELSFGGELGGLDPNLTLILADTDEIQTDQADGGRLDLIWDAIKLVTDRLPMQVTTVSDANDANSFTLTAGVAVADAYNGTTISIQDAGDSHWESRMIYDWTAAKVVIVDIPFGFTPAANDVVVLWNIDYFPIDVYEYNPPILPPEPIIIDNTVGGGGGVGTTTLNADGDDP